MITREFDVSDIITEISPNFRGILVLYCDKEGGHRLETHGDHEHVEKKCLEILTNTKNSK